MTKIKELYFNEDEVYPLMLEFVKTKKPSDSLIMKHYELTDRLLRSPKYVGYSPELKEDMQSFSMYEFIKYGHNFNPSKAKSKNPAFTFITFASENSFKRVLKDYYKTKNLDNAMLSDIGLCEEWHENYAYKLSNQLDCDADRNEKLDSWSHDELDSMR